MRKLLLLMGILALLHSPAIAGRNANGALVLHTNDSYNWSNLTVCTQALPATCEEFNTTATRDADQVVWLVAAFNPITSPGVTVIYFGIDYDDANLDPGVNYRLCGPAGSLEVPDDDWPYSGRGNSVAFGSPVYSILYAFYAFRISGGTEGAYFCTDINPTGGYAAFVDDSNPPVIDMINLFGCVRWFTSGELGCPGGGGIGGACCLPTGECVFVSLPECEAMGGSFQGPSVPCDPNPCMQPEACCLPDGSCVMLAPDACVAAGGIFVGGPCDPNPCGGGIPGACCDVCTGECTITYQEDCAGDWMGPVTSCDPNPCTVPVSGACCIGQECVFVPECQCSGEWKGSGVPCDPNPCLPTPTESTTWGQIRADYR